MHEARRPKLFGSWATGTDTKAPPFLLIHLQRLE